MLQFVKYQYYLEQLPGEWLMLIITILVLPVGVFFGRNQSPQSKPQPQPRPQPKSYPQAPHDLSKREMDVLEKVCLGYSNQQIADSLFISLATVKTHVSSILLKFNVKRRTQLLHACREMKLFADTTKE